MSLRCRKPSGTSPVRDEMEARNRKKRRLQVMNSTSNREIGDAWNR